MPNMGANLRVRNRILRCKERWALPRNGEGMSPSTTSKVTTDHGEIRRWAEERGATPAAVIVTENDDDPSMIGLDFPGYSGEGSLEQISWDEWFKKFNEHNLVLLYQEHTAGGEKSNFNKIISRETAEEVNSAVGGKGRSASPKRASASRQRTSGANKGAGKSAKAATGSRANGSGRATGKPEGREESAKRSASARGRSSSSGRRAGEKRSSSATRGDARPGQRISQVPTADVVSLRMLLRRDDDPPIPTPPGEEPPPPVQEPPDKPVLEPGAPVREPGPQQPQRM